MWVQSLDGEDPLEEGMVTHSSILAGKIPWTEEPGGLRPGGVAKSWTLKQLSTAHSPEHKPALEERALFGDWESMPG